MTNRFCETTVTYEQLASGEMQATQAGACVQVQIENGTTTGPNEETKVVYDKQ